MVLFFFKKIVFLLDFKRIIRYMCNKTAIKNEFNNPQKVAEHLRVRNVV